MRRRCAAWASTTSTSTTSTACDPASPSRRPWGPWPSWWPQGKVRHLGPVRGRPGHPPPGRRRPPDRRPAERMVAVEPGHRGRGGADGPRARDRHRGLQPARARLPDGAITSPTTSPRATSAATSPGSTGDNFAAQPGAGRHGARPGRRAKGCTPGQVALAWVLARGDDVVPIPGTKRRTYLEENVAAADVVLSADDLRRSRRSSPRTRRRATGTRTWGRSGSRRRGRDRRGSADEPGPDRPGRRFASGTDAQPEVGVRGVVSDRLDRDTELGRDLRIGQAFGDESDDLGLAFGEGVRGGRRG